METENGIVLTRQKTLVALLIIPKLLYIARHHWPAISWVQGLDTRLCNFVWTGNFSDEVLLGAGTLRWMNKNLADLPAGAGGLGMPNLESELLTMATQVVAKWCYEPRGLRDGAAKLLSRAGEPVQVDLYLTSQGARPGIKKDLWETGRRSMSWIYSSTMTYPLQLLVQDAARALHGDSNWRWRRGGFERDYTLFHRIGGGEINRLRRETDGNLSPGWVPHLEITRAGSGILHSDGTLLRLSHLKALGPGRLVSDYVSWQWLEGRTLRFTPSRPFPLTNAQAATFINLCDILMDMEWTLEANRLTCFRDGLRMGNSLVAIQHELQRQPPVLLDERPVRPQFECSPALTCLVKPWRGDKPWVPKRQHHKRALSRKLRQAGIDARELRASRWQQGNPDIAAALESVPWHELGRDPGLTTYEHQLWARLRHHQLFLRQYREEDASCPSCSSTSTNTPAHLVWECDRAKPLWFQLARFWGVRNASEAEIRTAVFSRAPPASSYDWRSLFTDRASCVSDRLEHWERILWGQLVTSGLQRLWTQAVAGVTGNEMQTASTDYFAVIHNWTNKLRANITATYSVSGATKALDASILTTFYKCLATRAELPPVIANQKAAYVLFFDGGSRGNPGPGGSGAVIVRVHSHPELVWAGSMSYANRSTTNNFAEYQGLCTGLSAAECNAWSPLEVVGDSMMIIRQMTSRHKPKAPALLPLYEKARSIADALRVRGWSHHYRTHNKMADKAANQAMDSGTSYQAYARDARPELDELRVWLDNDVTQWLQQRV